MKKTDAEKPKQHPIRMKESLYTPISRRIEDHAAEWEKVGIKGTWQDVMEPASTLTSKHRLGLVTVHGENYVIVDIGLRMLRPNELLRAQFGKLSKHYVLVGTQSQQVKGIGNSVCPELAEMLVRCNVKIKKRRLRPNEKTNAKVYGRAYLFLVREFRP